MLKKKKKKTGAQSSQCVAKVRGEIKNPITESKEMEMEDAGSELH